MSCSRPTDLAAAAMRCIERPTRQTRRPAASAARMTLSMRATLEAKQATATLPFSAPISSVSAIAHVGLRAGLAVDEDVGGVADHGQHALVAEAADGVDVGALRRAAGPGSIFQSPVCRIVPSGVRIARPFGSGIEWVRVISSTSNGPSSMVPPSGTSVIVDLVQQVRLAQLLADQEGGERRGVERRLQARPQPAERRRCGPRARGSGRCRGCRRRGLEEGRVGQDDLDAGRRLVAEGHAEVDDDPLAVVAAGRSRRG